VHILEHLLEGGAADNLQLVIREAVMSRDVVETANLSLYCYSFHLILLFCVLRCVVLFCVEIAQGFLDGVVVLIEVLHPSLLIEDIVYDA
jgi:hypothetical protein